MGVVCVNDDGERLNGPVSHLHQGETGRAECVGPAVAANAAALLGGNALTLRIPNFERS